MTDVWKAAHFYFPRRVELHLLTNVTLLLRLPGALTDAPKRKFMIFHSVVIGGKKIPHYSRRDMR